MEGALEVSDQLLKSAASRLRGTVRRQFLAEVCELLCHGNAREAEYRFDWGRETIAKGMEERQADPEELASRASNHRGQPRTEDRNPQMAMEIRLIVEPHTQTDPELKSERLYANLSAALLDRLTHHCHIFEMNGESYRFKESMKEKQSKVAKPKHRTGD